MERYWKLETPCYETDYESIFLNGDGLHPYGLPGVKCSVCGETWSDWRILPFECPRAFRQLRVINDGWPISEKEHLELRKNLLEELKKTGVEIESLMPGDCFQPPHLEFPSRPRSSFLWSTLGSVVVSPKVKDLFEKENITGIEFCQAIIEKVGKRESTGPVPIPETGEPVDVINEVEMEPHPEGFGPLFDMVVTSESSRPPGAEVITRCAACGREEYDRKKRQLVLTERMVPETDIFFLATTLHIIVNDRVRDVILQNRLTNVELQEMGLHDPNL